MDEFIKADSGMTLETWGVSTCTALVATIPKRFSYMAHISPKDKIYNDNETNLLGQILKRIKGFDIYASEARNVDFIIISPHLDSLRKIIEFIVEYGFSLSQIKLAYNPGAKSAALSNNFMTNQLTVEWSSRKNETYKTYSGLDHVFNIGKIVDGLISSSGKIN